MKKLFNLLFILLVVQASSFAQAAPEQLKKNCAICQQGLDLLKANMYKYPSKPSEGADGKMPWTAVWTEFTQTNLPACKALGTYVNTNSDAKAVGDIKASYVEFNVQKWEDYFESYAGIVTHGSRIPRYCPGLHRSQYDCLEASRRMMQISIPGLEKMISLLTSVDEANPAMVQLLYSGSEGRRNFQSEIDAGDRINLEVIFVDWSDQTVAAGNESFDALWKDITSDGALSSSFERMGVDVDVTLHKTWKRMPKTFAEYFPTGRGWNWQEYVEDGVALLPNKAYTPNSICVVVPNKGVEGFTAPSGAHGTSFNGLNRLISLSPDVYNEHYTTLMHEIGHSYGSGELYPATTPYLHEVAGYDVMGDVVYATGFLGYHRFRYGWIDNSAMRLLNKKGSYKIDLKKISQPESGKNMVVIPDATNMQKLWIIEIGQDVVSREQFKAGKGEKMNSEGDRLIVYTVQSPELSGKRAIRIVPRVGFDQDQGSKKWLDDASYVAGQTFSDQAAPFSFSVDAKSPGGFQLTVTVKEDIPLVVFPKDHQSSNGEFKLVAQSDGNLVIKRSSDNAYVWDVKTKLFTDAPSDHSTIVVLKEGNIQLVKTSDGTTLKEEVTGAPANAMLTVSDEGTLQVTDAANKVWWSSK
ncbi:hypothetical protein [Lewinella sp. JB7]|uniref:hypothetical protein n=1 Tax=Lewinella sp. JB7 TaxID=2962887 RepID=UPI0020C98050|nr:hypothetical protein [Lewinella sp. JB7]MCP9235223.1 hypothetical protein [Lewinella sp. JB7]